MGKKCFHIIVLIVWLVVIFLMSAKTADDSTKMSNTVGKIVASVFVPTFEQWSESKQDAFADRIDYPIRKAAHATEYAICLVFFLWFYMDYEKTVSYRYRLALISTVLYAATDEFHQLFVPGRSGRITDVMIDAAGALLGLLFVKFVSYVLAKRSGDIV